MKRLWKPRNLVWLALPILLWWALREISLVEVVDKLSGLGLPQLALLVAFNLFATLFFSSRWWLILRALGHRVPYLSLLGYRTAAFSLSYFTPGTQFGGEPLQVYLLENRHHVPGSSALASVTLDKLFELLANFTFLSAGVIIILQAGLFAGIAPLGAIIWISGLFLLPLGYLVTLWAGRYPLTWLVTRLPSRLFEGRRMSQVPELVASTESQISSLFKEKPSAILGILLASGLIWCLSIAEYWLSLYLLGAQLTLLETISALTAARIAFLTPLPGGLGALEASQALAMQALGLSPALGISVSLWIRARDVGLGALGLWWGTTLVRYRPALQPPIQAGD